MRDFPSPSDAGKFNANAILRPPRRPPQVIIIAVFFSKVLINNEYPFALVKYLNENFINQIEFKCKNAKLKIRKPDWIKG